MSLAYTGRPKDKQRVESLALGIGCDSLSDGTCNLVADAAAIVLKCVTRIKLRVKVGNDIGLKRIDRMGLHGGTRTRAFDSDRRGGVLGHCVILIEKLHLGSVNFTKSRRKELHIFLLKLLNEKGCRNHQFKRTAIKAY